MVRDWIMRLIGGWGWGSDDGGCLHSFETYLHERIKVGNGLCQEEVGLADLILCNTSITDNAGGFSGGREPPVLMICPEYIP
jgi:hypothetical protein